MLPDETFNFRYVDWSGERGSGRELPAVLDIRDFQSLQASDALFARKVHPIMSSALMNEIDQEILQRAEPRVASVESHLRDR